MNLNLANRQTFKDDPNVLYNGHMPQLTHKHIRLGYIVLGNAYTVDTQAPLYKQYQSQPLPITSHATAQI